MSGLPVEQAGEGASFEQLLLARHSCRAFLPTSVDRDVIQRILRTAQLAPSWCNAQPWKLIITGGEATERFRRELLEHIRASQPEPDIPFPQAYRGVYLDRRRTCGFQLYEAVGIARGDREASSQQARENFRFFGAPHVAIVTSDVSLGQYGTIDCGAYVTTFLLAAAAHGVASIAQAALASYSPFLRAYFDIPEDRVIVCGISFGYADQDHPANRFRTTRAPLNEVVDWRG
ncbi:nitroreductase [Burkholderia multivorans]|uniref:Nitroreductase n=1 Tax=Burkholderia multivorans TaxID=87883 RepID=A0AAP2HRX7_9BURK|nr:nitroreductase [Burkholderia multivorans]MBU9360469.1 nitroreductase [Burkholderia multivorans]MBU9370006.1 nitroreductase [Burkholderia multivorans]HDR9017795.1 nitroreductase [Burkholderia vietnamiensis]